MKYVVTLQTASNYDSVVHFYGYFSRPRLSCTAAQLSSPFYYCISRLSPIILSFTVALALTLLHAFLHFANVSDLIVSFFYYYFFFFFFVISHSSSVAFFFFIFTLRYPPFSSALLRPHLLVSFHPISLTHPFLSGR